MSARYYSWNFFFFFFFNWVILKCKSSVAQNYLCYLLIWACCQHFFLNLLRLHINVERNLKCFKKVDETIVQVWTQVKLLLMAVKGVMVMY